jgi:hypothetical protein
MSLLQQYLVEQLLDESLDDAFGFYKDKLSREQFDKLIALDPTFKIEEDKIGTYGKWILKAFMKGDLKEEEFPRVTEILDDFHNRKRFITKPNGKDIGTYKNLEEIRAGLDTVQLSDNQRERLRRKQKHYADLGEDAEFIGETEDWEIWIPKTYAASMKLGSGTQWCTASTGDRGERYFHQYTDRWSDRGYGRNNQCGKLYVFMNKKNANKKYQLQVIFDANDVPVDIGDFMDINDSRADLPDFLGANDLADVLLQTNLKELSEVKAGKKIQDILSGGSITIQDSSKGYVELEDGVRIDFSSFKDNPKIKEFIILDETDEDTTVSDFNGFSMERVVFSNNSKVTNIYEKAFKDCKNLKEVVLPPKLISIGESAFEGCTKLGEVFLPDSLVYIGYNAFKDCNNLSLTMNKRGKNNQVKVPQEDVGILKSRLKVLVKEGQDMTEATVLNEVFSPSTPDWFKKWSDELPLRYSRIDEILKGKRKGHDFFAFTSIDLKNAEFNVGPVPQTPRDPRLRDPNIPVYFLEYTDRQNGNIETMVHIPGITDEARVTIEGRSRIEDLGEINKTDLLTYTKAFAYLDKNRAENFFASEARAARRQRQPSGAEKRYSPEEQKKEYSWSRIAFDKSGYKLDPEILVQRLKEYNRENYAKMVKSYYQRLEVVRKEIHKQLVTLSIKDKRPDEKEVLKVHEKLFYAISAYRKFKEDLESILELSNKFERIYKLNTLFSINTDQEIINKAKEQLAKEGKEMRSFYPDVRATNLREKLIEVEQEFKRVNLAALEQLEEK